MGFILNPFTGELDAVGGAGGSNTTAISRINVSAGTTSNNLTAITFSNASGVSFGLNGSVLTATVQTNYLTTAMASNRGTDFVQAAAVFNGTNATGTIASGAISVSVAAPIPLATTVNSVASANSVGTVTRYAAEDHRHAGIGAVGISTSGNTAGTTGSVLGTYWFQGGNSLTLSQITSNNGSHTLVFSAGNYLTTAMASNRGTDFVQATAAFNGTNATGTIASGAISVSVAAPIPIATAVNPVASAGSTGTVTRYAPEDHRHAGVGGIGISTSGNTAGTTGSVVGTYWLQGGNSITVSQITSNNGSHTLVISAGNYITTAMASNRGTDFVQATAAFAGTSASGTIASNGISVSIGPYITAETQSQSFGASNLGNTLGTSGIASGGQVRAVVVGGSNVTISQSINGASATQTLMAGGTHSFYPFNAQVEQSGAVQIGNSTLMMFPLCVKEFVSFSRVQHYISVSHSSSGDTRTLRLTLGASIGIYTRNASTFNSASSTTGNWNITISSQDSTASFSGLRFLTFALNASLTPGDYWVAFVSSTASALQAGGGNAMTFSNMADLYPIGAATSFGMFSAALNASNQMQFGKGVYSVATNGIPTAIQASELTGSYGSARVPYLYGVNLSQ